MSVCRVRQAPGSDLWCQSMLEGLGPDQPHRLQLRRPGRGGHVGHARLLLPVWPHVHPTPAAAALAALDAGLKRRDFDVAPADQLDKFDAACVVKARRGRNRTLVGPGGASLEIGGKTWLPVMLEQAPNLARQNPC
jgi:hypothetical protein